MYEHVSNIENPDFLRFFGTGNDASLISEGGRPLLVWGIAEGFLKYRTSREAATLDALRVQLVRLKGRADLYARMAAASTSGKNFQVSRETALKVAEDIPSLASFGWNLSELEPAGREKVKGALQDAASRLASASSVLEKASSALASHIRNESASRVLSDSLKLASGGLGLSVSSVPETVFGSPAVMKVWADPQSGPVWRELSFGQAPIPFNDMEEASAKRFAELMSQGLESESRNIANILSELPQQYDIRVSGVYLSMKTPELVDCEGRNISEARSAMEGRHAVNTDGVIWRNLSGDSGALLIEPASANQVRESVTLEGWSECLGKDATLRGRGASVSPSAGAEGLYRNLVSRMSESPKGLKLN